MNCAKCGISRQVLHRDHIIPKWQGGSDDEMNIQRLCANCHEDKTYGELKSVEWSNYASKKLHGRKGHSPSELTRQVIREKLSGRKLSDAHRRAVSEGLRGRTLSVKHRQHLSNALQGRMLNPDVYRKSGETRRGRKTGPQSNQHRKAISEGLRRFWSERKNGNGQKVFQELL